MCCSAAVVADSVAAFAYVSISPTLTVCLYLYHTHCVSVSVSVSVPVPVLVVVSGVTEVMLACGLSYERQTVVDSYREKRSKQACPRLSVPPSVCLCVSATMALFSALLPPLAA